jgi:hypothetical protein
MGAGPELTPLLKEMNFLSAHQRSR